MSRLAIAMMTMARVQVESPEAIVARIASARGPTLVAVGQFSQEIPTGWAERVGLLKVGGWPRVIADVWIDRQHLSELRESLSVDQLGGWDVMYATRWRWAWGGAPFTLWSRRGMVARVRGPGRLEIARFAGYREHAVSAVRAEISTDWAWHRVGVRTSDGGPLIWLAVKRELFAVLDPTYDGIDLHFDASWAVEFGRSLAGALAVPYEASEDLK